MNDAQQARKLSDPRDRSASGTEPESCCMFVMEAGSRWPSSLEAPPASRIVAQNSGESAAQFASRVVRAMDSVRSLGQNLDGLVIAAGWVDDDEQSLFARSLIAQAAARAMDGRPGTLLLSGHDRLPEPARHELLATACALANQLVGSRMDVRVRFETARTGPVSASPSSGVFTRAEAVQPSNPEADGQPARRAAAAHETVGQPARRAAAAHGTDGAKLGEPPDSATLDGTRPRGPARRRAKRGRQVRAQVA